MFFICIAAVCYTVKSSLTWMPSEALTTPTKNMLSDRQPEHCSKFDGVGVEVLWKFEFF